MRGRVHTGDRQNARAGHTNYLDSDNGGYGINGPGNGGLWVGFNRFRDNTSGAFTGFDDWENNYAVTTDTGGQSTDYTDASTDDYTPIAASPMVDAGVLGFRNLGYYQQSAGD